MAVRQWPIIPRSRHFSGPPSAIPGVKNNDGIPHGLCQSRAAMKYNIMLTIAAAVLSVTAARALDIPRTVHRTADLTKAFDEAAKSKRGILWIYTDSKLKPS
jgi:hypothetical protein